VAVRAVVLTALVIAIVGCGADEQETTATPSMKASPAAKHHATVAHSAKGARTPTYATTSAQRLDAATAALVTNWSDDAYWLCGEGDCGYEARRCFRMAPQRIDCAVGYGAEGEPEMCGVVVAVVLRGVDVFSDSYECGGLMRDVTRMDDIETKPPPKLKHFRIDESWYELGDEPNKWGVPRFDPARDVYVGTLPLTP
jgi:hypothetical protein